MPRAAFRGGEGRGEGNSPPRAYFTPPNIIFESTRVLAIKFMILLEGDGTCMFNS